jgi:hypothetical protein
VLANADYLKGEAAHWREARARLMARIGERRLPA